MPDDGGPLWEWECVECRGKVSLDLFNKANHHGVPVELAVDVKVFDGHQKCSCRIREQPSGAEAMSRG